MSHFLTQENYLDICLNLRNKQLSNFLLWKIVTSDEKWIYFDCLKRKTFEEVQKWVDDFLASQDETFLAEGIRELPKRWLKVIESDGDYFD